MKIRTLKTIRTQAGRIPVGAEIELPDALARFFLERGEAEIFYPRPTEASGDKPSALPVAQALTQTTSSESESGARKRGRPRKITDE